MSKREEKRQAYTSMLIPQPKTDLQKIGDKVCGNCKNFFESSWSSDGRGTCKLLKFGSNIYNQPPVYILEGKDGYPTKTLHDASTCKYYDKMTFVDKDGYECSDPQYRRGMRQLQEKD